MVELRMQERLQKIIAAAGITSRRAAEELIAEGRVRLNGKVVTELGTKADASKYSRPLRCSDESFTKKQDGRHVIGVYDMVAKGRFWSLE